MVKTIDWRKAKVVASRKPTSSEIKFGYGAYHYATFDDWMQWVKNDGSIKRWTLINGVRWEFSHWSVANHDKS
jgi:hypothetical protein